MAAVLAGCQQSQQVGRWYADEFPAHRPLAQGASGQPALAPTLAGTLESDLGEFERPEVVSLPPMEKWPRILRDAGPIYAVVQFSPLVIPIGDLKNAGRADTGYGFGVLVGYRRPLTNAMALGFELQGELSEHVNTAADVGAHQTRFGGAVRAVFNFDEKLRPFAVAGGGQYNMKFDSVDPDFYLSGLGVFMGGGMDYVHSDRLTIRGEMTLHIWDAAERGDPDKGGTAWTLFVGFGAAFSF